MTASQEGIQVRSLVLTTLLLQGAAGNREAIALCGSTGSRGGALGGGGVSRGDVESVQRVQNLRLWYMMRWPLHPSVWPGSPEAVVAIQSVVNTHMRGRRRMGLAVMP